jgi:peroxiredoxin
MRISLLVAVSSFAIVGCGKAPPPAVDTSTSSAIANANANAAVPGATEKAEIGKAAPDFTLKDLDGHDVRLSSFKGKTVVLEWWNPGCPFVKAAHTKGSLKDAAMRHTKEGVVWLAINSAAPGKQGATVESNRESAKAYGVGNPILLDDTGSVGKAYGATNTPHMMVIDPKGVLVYRGAIDNSPDGEGESAPDGKLVSYVDVALADLGAGRPVATSETKAYGCGVKYAH